MTRRELRPEILKTDFSNSVGRNSGGFPEAEEEFIRKPWLLALSAALLAFGYAAPRSFSLINSLWVGHGLIVPLRCANNAGFSP